jgi:hypothetical protein
MPAEWPAAALRDRERCRSAPRSLTPYRQLRMPPPTLFGHGVGTARLDDDAIIVDCFCRVAVYIMSNGQ